MLTLRTSATDLDALRRFLADDDPSPDALPALLAQLRRELPPTESMRAGTALHALLETAKDGDVVGLTDGEFTFSFEGDMEVSLPPIREMKETRLYLIDGVRVTLVGKVDAIHGRRVIDHKFTTHYDAERFLGSMQWRCYLEVFGADEFQWNVFEGRESAPKNYIIRALHELVTHRYPGMGTCVEDALRQFLAFARVHLPEKLVPWEPEPHEFLAAG